MNANNKFKIGDKCQMVKNPYDEQIIGEEIKYLSRLKTIQIVTEIRDVSVESGTSGQWIKTNLENDWIDKAYFEAIN